MEKSDVEKTVYDARPELLRLVNEHGQGSYTDYLKKISLPALTRDMAIDTIFWKAYESILRRFFDTRTFLETKDELGKYFFASTADHGGPLCHPFFSNAFFARAEVTKMRGAELVLTLPCSGVSLDNSSFPRGLFFHDENLDLVRLPIKSLAERHDSVFATSPYTHDDVRRIQDKIPTLHLSPKRKQLLGKIISSVFDRESVYARATYDEQMVQVNWALPKYIQGYEHVEHISLSQEMLVRELVQLEPDTSPIAELLYNKEVQDAYVKIFDGIQGAHDGTKERGTHLLWGLQSDGVRKQLTIGKDGWYTNDGELFLSRDKESVCRAFEEYRVYPSMSLCFITLSFVHGMTTGGGFSQINYLGDMQKAYKELAQRFNWHCEKFPETNIFTGEYVGHVLEKGNKKVPATLLDVILYQTNTTKFLWENSLTSTPLLESILAMMPEYYKIVTGKEAENADFPLPPSTLHVTTDTNN